MSPLRAFKIIRAVTLHLKTEFSILRYGTSLDKLDSSYNALSDANKGIYSWAATKFPTEQDLIYCTIANILAREDIRFSERKVVVENFLKFKGRRESLSYYMKEDFEKWSHKKLPLRKYIFKYLVSETSPEFILLLSEYEGNSLPELLDDRNFSFISSEIHKLIKYKDLVSLSKYLTLFSEQNELAES